MTAVASSAATPVERDLPDVRRLAQAVAELVQIPSVHPLHAGPRSRAAGPDGEGALAMHLVDALHRVGASEVVTDEVEPGRPNVYAFVPGRTDRLVVVDVHTDTVSVEHMTDPPFDGRIADGHVWGRGALDTKATLGVLLTLLDDWRAAGLRPEPTLLVVATVGEEAGGLLGATRFRAWAQERGLDVDQVLVAEPTGFAPVHGLRSLVLAEVTTHGVAAHSAQPELGENAIDAMAPVLAAFAGEAARLRAASGSTALGAGSLAVTGIAGGVGTNIVPDRCTLTVSRRIVPGERPADVLDGLRRLAEDAAPGACTVRSLLPDAPDGQPGWPAFHQDPDGPLVTLLADLCGTAPAAAPFGANALRYSGLAREVVVLGPGSIDHAHQPTERVALDDLGRTAAVLRAWLRPGPTGGTA